MLEFKKLILQSAKLRTAEKINLKTSVLLPSHIISHICTNMFWWTPHVYAVLTLEVFLISHCHMCSETVLSFPLVRLSGLKAATGWLFGSVCARLLRYAAASLVLWANGSLFWKDNIWSDYAQENGRKRLSRHWIVNLNSTSRRLTICSNVHLYQVCVALLIFYLSASMETADIMLSSLHVISEAKYGARSLEETKVNHTL